MTQGRLAEVAQEQTWPGFLRGTALFVCLTAVLWSAFEYANLRFPYIRPGSDLVHDLKTDVLSRAAIFHPDAKLRVLAFGDSRMMAGFRPDYFAAALGPGTEAYNFGLPSDRQFVGLLQKIMASGTRPTHILLQLPWSPGPSAPAAIDWLTDDERIVLTLAPFKYLPRNLLAFALSARGEGWGRAYDANRQSVAGVAANRGWYFIKSQSLYPGDALPPDFRLPRDKPNLHAPRRYSTSAWEWTVLRGLALKYRFSVFLIPPAYRERAYAPTGQGDDREVTISREPDVRVIGPDYYLLPPPDFSDPVHLNPSGSAAYSRRLAELVRRHIGAAQR